MIPKKTSKKKHMVLRSTHISIRHQLPLLLLLGLLLHLIKFSKIKKKIKIPSLIRKENWRKIKLLYIKFHEKLKPMT